MFLLCNFIFSAKILAQNFGAKFVRKTLMKLTLAGTFIGVEGEEGKASFSMRGEGLNYNSHN